MAMEQAGIKADTMARELGVHRGTITRWIHEIGSPPKRAYIQRWADLTGVPYEWLAGGDAADNGLGASRNNDQYVPLATAA